MQTTKFLVVIGAVVAIWANPLQSFAGPDSEAQARMREALRQKMEALNEQATPAPTPVPAQPSPAPKAVAPTVVVPVPVEPELVKPVPAPVAAPAKSDKNDSRFSEVPVASDDEAAAKMRAALRQTIAIQPAPAAKPATAVTAVTPAPAPASTSMVARQAPVMSEPAIAPAFPASKQERLAALLQQYKADQISPQQYHTQRAAIIAEP